MKSTVFALLGLGGLAAIYAISSKLKAASQATAQTDGTVGSYYNPKARIFAPDQANSGMRSPIIARPVNIPIVPPVIAATDNNASPSGTTAGFCSPLGCTPTQPPTMIAPNSAMATSPYFWAADKVPVNPNMPFSDADPLLATSWTEI